MAQKCWQGRFLFPQFIYFWANFCQFFQSLFPIETNSFCDLGKKNSSHLVILRSTQQDWIFWTATSYSLEEEEIRSKGRQWEFSAIVTFKEPFFLVQLLGKMDPRVLLVVYLSLCSVLSAPRFPLNSGVGNPTPMDFDTEAAPTQTTTSTPKPTSSPAKPTEAVARPTTTQPNVVKASNPVTSSKPQQLETPKAGSREDVPPLLRRLSFSPQMPPFASPVLMNVYCQFINQLNI